MASQADEDGEHMAGAEAAFLGNKHEFQEQTWGGNMAKPAKSHKGEIRNHRTAKSDRLPPEIHGLRLEAVCCGREFKTKGSR